MADDEQRYRLVILGAGRVGKSSIVSRLLHGKFVETYKPTVEDLHCRTFHVDGSVIQVHCIGRHCYAKQFCLSVCLSLLVLRQNG